MGKNFTNKSTISCDFWQEIFYRLLSAINSNVDFIVNSTDFRYNMDNKTFNRDKYFYRRLSTINSNLDFIVNYMNNKTFMQTSGINNFIGTKMLIRTCINFISIKEVKSQPKHPSSKKSCSQDLKKAVMKKMWHQKGAAKACAGMLLITLTIFNMMTQAIKHFLRPETRKMFWSLGHHYQIFNVINSIPAQALTAPHIFHHSLFRILAATFFTARVFLVGMMCYTSQLNKLVF